MSVFLDWPIVGLLVGLVGVLIAGTWIHWRVRSKQWAQSEADQTAAHARALQRLAADLRRRTTHDQENDDHEDLQSRIHDPRNSDSKTTQRRRG